MLPHHLEDTEKRLVQAANGTDPIDMEAVFLELTTKLMGEMAYDVSLNPNEFSKTWDGQLLPPLDPDQLGLDRDKRFVAVFQGIRLCFRSHR